MIYQNTNCVTICLTECCYIPLVAKFSGHRKENLGIFLGWCLRRNRNLPFLSHGFQVPMRRFIHFNTRAFGGLRGPFSFFSKPGLMFKHTHSLLEREKLTDLKSINKK